MVKNIMAGILLLVILAISGDGPYKDGVYTGSSRSYYTDEPYYGFSEITIEKGRITKVGFYIRDSARHVLFDGGYEKYFAGNDEYIRQCRNDWRGINSYPDSLLKRQDPERVDAITGATWSYNIFRASVRETLSGAEKK